MRPCWRVRKNTFRCFNANKNPSVQKLRSSISRSLLRMLGSTFPKSARSCVWKSSQGMTSSISIRCGSNNASTRPGKAPAAVPRNTFSR